jgi:putative Holliday junction resolvase
MGPSPLVSSLLSALPLLLTLPLPRGEGSRRRRGGGLLRYMGVDLGTKRIGIALSDPMGMIASPLLVIQRAGGARDLQEVATLARDYDVGAIVVGLPVDLKGQQGVAAQNTLAEIEQLRGMAGIPVETYDERLTSAAAARTLRDGGLDSRGQRGLVDKVAAALLLQSYLEQRRYRDASQQA